MCCARRHPTALTHPATARLTPSRTQYEYAVAHGKKPPKKPKQKAGEKRKAGEKQKAGEKKVQTPKAKPEVLAAALKALQRAKWDVFTAMTRDGSVRARATRASPPAHTRAAQRGRAPLLSQSNTPLTNDHLKQLVIHKGLWATLKSMDSNPQGPGRMLMVRELTKVSGIFADDAARMAAPE